MPTQIKACLYLVSSRPGVQDGTTLLRYNEKIECDFCPEKYFLEYNPPDLSSTPDGLDKLLKKAKMAVNQSHAGKHPSPIQIPEI
jgi:hypothetical protein